MGFWHTGYMEFHERTGLDTSYVPLKTRYACQHCDQRFDDIEVLRRHRFERHPVTRPLLFIQGAELGASTFLVKQPLAPSDIQADRAASASIDGVNVPIKELPIRLAGAGNSRICVQLANEGAVANFDILIEIASEQDLAGVETAFLKLSRGRQLTIQTIETFIADCREYRSAARYLDGLCHYLYGVLAKERAGDSGLPFDEYRNRYSRAADELKGFDRPLARLVRALVEFHFNHFRDAEGLAPTGRLTRAASIFAAALDGKPWVTPAHGGSEQSDAVEDLLTDHETLRILQFATVQEANLGRKTSAISDQLRRDLPGFDRTKLVILLGEAALDSANADMARRAARELIGNNNTSAWAMGLLARLTMES